MNDPATSSTSASSPPFLAFASDGEAITTLKAFAESRQWPADGVYQGDIATAAQFLKTHASPAMLVVEIPSASEAQGLLDQLAEVCDPNTKVVVIGTVNEYSFYCWLMDIGIGSYLLKPLNQQMLEGAYQRVMEPATQEKQPGKVIACLGARGGVGTTAMALNLAGIIADVSGKRVALADLDPQEGSIALSLDIEPCRGVRDAMEKPDRIDSLFIERVMSKPFKNLSVMSAEESLMEPVHVNEHTAAELLKELRSGFDVVVLDVPRHLSLFHRQCLKQAAEVVLVTELTLAGLRDTLRLSDMLQEALKLKPPVVVANRVGMAAKQEMATGDFEKGINAKIAHKVPFAPELFMPIGSDIPAVKQKSHAAAAPVYALAGQLVPEAKTKALPKEKKALSLFKKSKGT